MTNTVQPVRRCEGCDETTETTRVHVVGERHDWGFFHYCPGCIEADKKCGFNVEPASA